MAEYYVVKGTYIKTDPAVGIQRLHGEETGLGGEVRAHRSRRLHYLNPLVEVDSLDVEDPDGEPVRICPALVIPESARRRKVHGRVGVSAPV